MIRGIIFDFDGLVLDTEWPVYQSWVEIFEPYDAKLPLDKWTSIIGTSQHEHFDPCEILEAQIGRNLDRKELQEQHYEREIELVLAQPILPGVVDYLRDAKTLGLKLGMASSSRRDWVRGHLARLDLLDYFDAIFTADDVERTKPDPALYQLALQGINLPSEDAFVLEDSPNGITAAKAAGLFAVAVPNPLTAPLNFDHADLVLAALSEMRLTDLIEIVENHREV